MEDNDSCPRHGCDDTCDVLPLDFVVGVNRDAPMGNCVPIDGCAPMGSDVPLDSDAPMGLIAKVEDAIGIPAGVDPDDEAPPVDCDAC